MRSDIHCQEFWRRWQRDLRQGLCDNIGQPDLRVIEFAAEEVARLTCPRLGRAHDSNRFLLTLSQTLDGEVRD